MNSAKILAVALVSLIGILTGCRSQKLTRDQLPGTWRMERADTASSTSADAPTLSLDPDGKFIAHALPAELVEIDGIKQRQAISGTGTWSVRHGDDYRLLLWFTTINGQDFQYGAELFPQSPGSKLRLYYSEGDPDEEHRIYFDRDAAHRR